MSLTLFLCLVIYPSIINSGMPQGGEYGQPPQQGQMDPNGQQGMYGGYGGPPGWGQPDMR